MNEEPIAVCNANFTQKEFVRMFAYRVYRNPVILLINIFFVLIGLFLFIDLLLGIEIKISLLLQVIIYLILLNGMTYVVGRIRYRQNCSMLPQNSQMQTVFFSDRAEKRQNGMATKVLYYRDIKKIRHHNRVHYLVFPNLIWFAVPDDQFIQGNWDTVWNVIRDKKRK